MKKVFLFLVFVLSANVVFAQDVKQTTVPTIHNTRIDNTFRKFARTGQEIQQVNTFINSLYQNKGTFLASALIQHELDRQQIYLLLNENTDLLIRVNPNLGKEVKEIGTDFYKSVRPNAKHVSEWLDKNYTPKLMGLLYFDHKPTAEEVIDRLDDIAENKANFSSDDILKYTIASNSFKRLNKINDKSDDISLSNLIAFKMFMIDKIIFKQTLENNDFFGKDSQFRKYANLEGYYNDWMNCVSPKENSKQ